MWASNVKSLDSSFFSKENRDGQVRWFRFDGETGDFVDVFAAGGSLLNDFMKTVGKPYNLTTSKEPITV